MRSWRVGSISMGVALIMLGIYLAASAWMGAQVWDAWLSWWPLILILLGAEILVYLFLNRSQTSSVRYDLWSVLFVGLLGMAGISMFLLTTTGVMKELRHAIGSTVRTYDLPTVQLPLSSDVNRIVVHTGRELLQVEGISSEEVRLAGTYRVRTSEDDPEVPLEAEQLYHAEKVDQTLHLFIKEVPRRDGPLSVHPVVRRVLMLPQDRQVEIRAHRGELQISPGYLKNHWLVQSSGPVTVQLPEDGDVLLTAVTDEKLLDGNVAWSSLTPLSETDEGNPGRYQGRLQVGQGSYELQILGHNWLTVYLQKM